mmetsp:Transcript_1850/g.3334  ORF Transcript_1850/g.3334 Transcript_1850/m.3334 type:complete len:249 (-) Transcript_1850:97-843(-)
MNTHTILGLLCILQITIFFTIPSAESLSIRMMSSSNNVKTFHFGAGCFWAPADKIKSKKGIVSASVGYCGDDNIQYTPTYESVCAGKTRLVEAVRVQYDANQLTFQDLLKYFNEVNTAEKGNKRQYEGVLFVSSDGEAEIAKTFLRDNQNVAATVEPMSNTFFEAEPYHQNYWSKWRIRVSILVLVLALGGKFGGDMSQTIYNVICYSFIALTLLERKFDNKVDKISLEKVNCNANSAPCSTTRIIEN